MYIFSGQPKGSSCTLSAEIFGRNSAERLSDKKCSFCLSAETLSFGRKNLFLQKDPLSVVFILSFSSFFVKNTQFSLQKDALSAETAPFCQKSFFLVFLYFCRKTLFRQKQTLSAERVSFCSFCISADMIC